MYSVPNARNEREIRNPNVLIYQLVGVSYELKSKPTRFNIILVIRTKLLFYKVFLFYGAHLYLRRATDLIADPFPHFRTNVT